MGRRRYIEELRRLAVNHHPESSDLVDELTNFVQEVREKELKPINTFSKKRTAKEAGLGHGRETAIYQRFKQEATLEEEHHPKEEHPLKLEAEKGL